MKCPSVPVTQADIRAESWLAIAGGATRARLLPERLGRRCRSDHPRDRDADQAARARALVQPALPVAVDPSGSQVRASARELDGALYILAVNPTDAPVDVTLQQHDLGDRSVQVLGGRP